MNNHIGKNEFPIDKCNIWIIANKRKPFWTISTLIISTNHLFPAFSLTDLFYQTEVIFYESSKHKYSFRRTNRFHWIVANSRERRVIRRTCGFQKPALANVATSIISQFTLTYESSVTQYILWLATVLQVHKPQSKWNKQVNGVKDCFTKFKRYWASPLDWIN